VKTGLSQMLSLAVALLAGCSAAGDRATHKEEMMFENTNLVIETSMGTVEAVLWADRAPETATNFLRYVDDDFFDGLIFHRVMPGFMIQGGGFRPDMVQKSTQRPIVNEADNGAANQRGTLAMARTGDPHSATAQFFINLIDNDFLNHTAKNPQGWGYCVFGKVTAGMDVVDAIAKVPTGNRGGHANVPVQPVVIKSIRRAP